MAPRIAVVDDRNRFLRWEERRAIHEQRLPHRSIHVMLFDAKGRLLLQRRHPQKQTYPDHWDSAVAGHVEEGDYPRGPDDELDLVYQRVAERELEEELGIKTALRLLGHFAPEPGVHYEHFRLYAGEHEGPFRLQPDEVTETRWVTKPELESLLASGNDKVTHLLAYLARWMQERGVWLSIAPPPRWGALFPKQQRGGSPAFSRARGSAAQAPTDD